VFKEQQRLTYRMSWEGDYQVILGEKSFMKMCPIHNGYRTMDIRSVIPEVTGVIGRNIYPATTVKSTTGCLK